MFKTLLLHLKECPWMNSIHIFIHLKFISLSVVCQNICCSFLTKIHFTNNNNNKQTTAKPQWSWLSNNDKCVLKNNWAITILLWIKNNNIRNRRKLNMNTKYNTLSWYWIFIVLKSSVVQCLIYKIWTNIQFNIQNFCLFLKKIFKKIWNVVWTK